MRFFILLILDEDFMKKYSYILLIAGSGICKIKYDYQVPVHVYTGIKDNHVKKW